MKKFTDNESRSTAVLAILRIIRGSMYFESTVKELYDYGICFYDETIKRVLPVNRCAELALYSVFSSYAPGALPSVSAAAATGLSQAYTGIIFEAQMLAKIAPKLDSMILTAEPLNVKGHNSKCKNVNFSATQIIEIRYH